MWFSCWGFFWEIRYGSPLMRGHAHKSSSHMQLKNYMLVGMTGGEGICFPMENKLLLSSENDSELLLRFLFWKVTTLLSSAVLKRYWQMFRVFSKEARWCCLWGLKGDAVPLFCAVVFISWMIVEFFLLEVPEGSRVLHSTYCVSARLTAVTGCCVTRESLEGVDSVGTLFWEGREAIWEEHGWPFWIMQGSLRNLVITWGIWGYWWFDGQQWGFILSLLLRPGCCWKC